MKQGKTARKRTAVLALVIQPQTSPALGSDSIAPLHSPIHTQRISLRVRGREGRGNGDAPTFVCDTTYKRSRVSKAGQQSFLVSQLYPLLLLRQRKTNRLILRALPRQRRCCRGRASRKQVSSFPLLLPLPLVLVAKETEEEETDSFRLRNSRSRSCETVPDSDDERGSRRDARGGVGGRRGCRGPCSCVVRWRGEGRWGGRGEMSEAGRAGGVRGG